VATDVSLIPAGWLRSRLSRILELPLTTTQDYSLFHILSDYSINLWKQQSDVITEKHGPASFIAHPRLHHRETSANGLPSPLGASGRIALPREVDRWGGEAR